MTLTAGTRLGPYEIEEGLGAGGMGEVYRARDTRLDRVVAIKILPPSLAQDETARARFEREAKAVAALSDPHILAIYDVDVQGATAYAVMELLEGETLRDRITRAPLPPNKAVQIAREIAQGLSAAHEKGLVHRDIKPGNVFVTTAGHVKILDFGLARQEERVPAGQTTALTAMQSTEPGTVLGTFGYMSPEQVRGEPADHRSDIFSLGCVLFEALSGRRPFERATRAETMTAILRDDPPDLIRSDGALPATLDQVIRHCLEKQPGERFQSARDLAFALQATAAGSSVSGISPPAVGAPPSRRGSTWWAVAAGAAALLIGTVAGRYLRAVSSTQPIAFEQVTDAPGVQTEPSVSPDGKTVVYAQLTDGRSQLYSLRIGSRTPTRLNSSPDDDDSEPAFSPNGERIAFRSERDGGGIFVMTATGESVTRLTRFGFHPSWSPDGSEIALAPAPFESPTDVGTSQPGLLVVNSSPLSSPGQQRELAKELRAFQPAWSPHGQRVAFWSVRSDAGQRDIYTVASVPGAAGASVPVTNDATLDWSPAWSPDGTHLYFSSRRGGTLNLWRIAIDEATGRTQGEPEPVTTPSNWSGYVSFSRDGSRMVFAGLDWRSTLFKVTIDLKTWIPSTPVRLFRDSLVIKDLDLSKDGWIAFGEVGDHENLIVMRTDGTNLSVLTNDAFRNRGPVWNPKIGGLLAYHSDRSDRYEVWTIRQDASDPKRLTTTASAGVVYPVWSPEGAHLAVFREQWWNIVDAGSDKTPVPTPAETLPHPRADMYFRPLTWSSDNSKHSKILGPVMGLDGRVRGYAVYDVASQHFSTVVPRDGARGVAWFPDNQHFLFRDRAGVWLASEGGVPPNLLVPVGGYAVGRTVAIAHDGRSFIYSETGTEGQIWLARMKK